VSTAWASGFLRLFANWRVLAADEGRIPNRDSAPAQKNTDNNQGGLRQAYSNLGDILSEDTQFTGIPAYQPLPRSRLDEDLRKQNHGSRHHVAAAIA